MCCNILSLLCVGTYITAYSVFHDTPLWAMIVKRRWHLRKFVALFLWWCSHSDCQHQCWHSMQTCLHLSAVMLLSATGLSDLCLWSPLGTVVMFVLQCWVYIKCAPLETMMTCVNKDLGKILFMNYLIYDKLQLCKQVASLVAVKLVLHEGD